MNPKISVNILNWNKPCDTLECIQSCLKLNYAPYEIIVIDNHSVDDSVKQFKEKFPEIPIIENTDNFGYAGGNNVGLKYALEHGADYVLLLNNDVTVHPKLLCELMDAARTHPQAGMAAPKVMYYDSPNIINSLGTTMDWLRLRPHLGECNQEDRGRFQEIMKKDILVGCALLIDRKTIGKIGLIDEKFFIFHEEADWCYRSLKSGFENIVVPRAIVYHKGSKTMREFSALTHYYSTRNFLYLTSKNASYPNLIKVLIGLSYLIIKNLFLLFTTNRQKQILAHSFFAGLLDYGTQRMGKCRRNFDRT